VNTSKDPSRSLISGCWQIDSKHLQSPSRRGLARFAALLTQSLPLLAAVLAAACSAPAGCPFESHPRTAPPEDDPARFAARAATSMLPLALLAGPQPHTSQPRRSALISADRLLAGCRRRLRRRLPEDRRSLAARGLSAAQAGTPPHLVYKHPPSIRQSLINRSRSSSANSVPYRSTSGS